MRNGMIEFPSHKKRNPRKLIVKPHKLQIVKEFYDKHKIPYKSNIFGQESIDNQFLTQIH